MKKILEIGTISPKPTYVARCECCFTKFTYQDEDVFWGIGTFNRELVECPICYKRLCADLIKYSEINDSLQQKKMDSRAV